MGVYIDVGQVTVSEPGTLMLIFTGLGAMGLSFRLKKK
jgi:hypothetical protein